MSEKPDATVEPVELFSPADVRGFAADDAEAGNAIGKMLSLFFLYTVVAMTVSALATWWWVKNVTVS